MNKRWIAVALGAGAALLLVLLANVAMVIMGEGAGEQVSYQKLAVGEMSGFTLEQRGAAFPDTAFQTGDGQSRTIGDFAGRVVLVNLWASWCAPCLTELPHLAALHKDMAGDAFQVVAVSLDRGGKKTATATLDKIGVEALPLYLNPKMDLGRALGANSMPVTVLVDPRGREIGRLTGAADWTSDEAKALIRAAIKARG